MADTTFNGWTNYETWLVNLWMDNEQGSQEFFRETAKEIYDQTNAYNTGLNKREYFRLEFADWLKRYYMGENRPELSGVYGDLLGAALASVNWDEIAQHYFDVVLEEVRDDAASA